MLTLTLCPTIVASPMTGVLMDIPSRLLSKSPTGKPSPGQGSNTAEGLLHTPAVLGPTSLSTGYLMMASSSKFEVK